MIEQYWIVVLAAATPIVGIVGFAIQLRTVRKVRLENEKLTLEIRRLQTELEKSSNLISRATDDEIERYSGVLFSRGFPGACPGDDGPEIRRRSFRRTLSDLALLVGGALFLTYLVFDSYRLIRWLWLIILGK